MYVREAGHPQPRRGWNRCPCTRERQALSASYLHDRLRRPQSLYPSSRHDVHDEETEKPLSRLAYIFSSLIMIGARACMQLLLAHLSTPHNPPTITSHATAEVGLAVVRWRSAMAAVRRWIGTKRRATVTQGTHGRHHHHHRHPSDEGCLKSAHTPQGRSRDLSSSTPRWSMDDIQIHDSSNGLRARTGLRTQERTTCVTPTRTQAHACPTDRAERGRSVAPRARVIHKHTHAHIHVRWCLWWQVCNPSALALC